MIAQTDDAVNESYSLKHLPCDAHAFLNRLHTLK